jgi:AcrR family transcriptional regulator
MPKPRQGVGRPRDNQVDHAIVDATRALLAERGYAGLTVDAVAARAGVGKAAIYRRYATKQEMIFSVVVHDMRQQPPPDAGSLRADLAAVCQTIAAQLGSAPTDVLTGLLADIYADSSLGDRFTETFLERERLVVTEVLNRAVARRELATVPDPATVHALLIGPIFAWLLILTGDRDKLPDLTRTVSEAVATVLLSEAVPS